jgi:cell wall-associated NlpC family hydrolase
MRFITHLSLILTVFILSKVYASSPPNKIQEDIEQSFQAKTLKTIQQYADLLEVMAPEYVWGGSNPLVWTYDTQKKLWRKGCDCSGSIHWILTKSGFKFPRVTSLKMWLTWAGIVTQDKKQIWEETMFPDLVFWTFPVKKGKAPRIAGHVGLVRKNKITSIEFNEASQASNRFKRTTVVPGDKHDMYLHGIKRLDLNRPAKPGTYK